MTGSPLKADLKVYDETTTWLIVEDGTSLPTALELAARHLTVDQRIQLIDRLHRQHADVESRFR